MVAYTAEWIAQSALVQRPLSEAEKVDLYVSGLRPGLSNEVARRAPLFFFTEASEFAAAIEHRYMVTPSHSINTVRYDEESDPLDMLSANFPTCQRPWKISTRCSPTSATTIALRKASFLLQQPSQKNRPFFQELLE